MTICNTDTCVLDRPVAISAAGRITPHNNGSKNTCRPTCFHITLSHPRMNYLFLCDFGTTRNVPYVRPGHLDDGHQEVIFGGWRLVSPVLRFNNTNANACRISSFYQLSRNWYSPMQFGNVAYVF